jgi:hypothetical protein
MPGRRELGYIVIIAVLLLLVLLFALTRETHRRQAISSITLEPGGTDYGYSSDGGPDPEPNPDSYQHSDTDPLVYSDWLWVWIKPGEGIQAAINANPPS